MTLFLKNNELFVISKPELTRYTKLKPERVYWDNVYWLMTKDVYTYVLSLIDYLCNDVGD